MQLPSALSGFSPKKVSFETISYIFSKKSFSNFQEMGLFYIFFKKDLIIFWQGYIQNSGISRALAYLDLEAY